MNKLERRYVYGKTRKEVVDKLADIQSQLRRGTWHEPTKLTTGEYLAEWLSYRKVNLRPNTVRTYQNSINKHILPYIGHIPLQKLQPRHLRALYTHMQTEKHLSVRMAEIAHRILHAALPKPCRKMDYWHRTLVPFSRTNHERIIVRKIERCYHAVKWPMCLLSHEAPLHTLLSS